MVLNATLSTLVLSPDPTPKQPIGDMTALDGLHEHQGAYLANQHSSFCQTSFGLPCGWGKPL